MNNRENWQRLNWATGTFDSWNEDVEGDIGTLMNFDWFLIVCMFMCVQLLIVIIW